MITQENDETGPQESYQPSRSSIRRPSDEPASSHTLTKRARTIDPIARQNELLQKACSFMDASMKSSAWGEKLETLRYIPNHLIHVRRSLAEPRSRNASSDSRSSDSSYKKKKQKLLNRCRPLPRDFTAPVQATYDEVFDDVNAIEWLKFNCSPQYVVEDKWRKTFVERQAILKDKGYLIYVDEFSALRAP
ncbi:hypothetical protein WDU94_015548 [Cyamophila willieti]